MDKSQETREFSCPPCGNELVTVPVEMPAGKTEGVCARCGRAFELPFYVAPDWILAPNGGAAHRGLIAERSDDRA